MSLLMDVSGYLKRYGSATEAELVRHFQCTPERMSMMTETLRNKGRIRLRRVLPACTGSVCSGTCCGAVASGSDRRAPVNVYEWIRTKAC